MNGQELTALAPKELRQARRKIGMIFQHFNLMKSRTVYSNVACPLRGSPLSEEERRDEVDEPTPEARGPGRKRRWPIRRSFPAGKSSAWPSPARWRTIPTVLLCDEATSALDPQTTQDILRLLRDVNRKLGITIVLITHEIAVVKEILHAPGGDGRGPRGGRGRD